MCVAVDGACTQRQGFHHLVVPDKEEAIGEELVESLEGEHGVQVLVAEGPGRRLSYHPEYDFVPMLKFLLVDPIAHETEGGSDTSIAT
jgi:hypothetical protein